MSLEFSAVVWWIEQKAFLERKAVDKDDNRRSCS
jgi:hypothetical protein